MGCMSLIWNYNLKKVKHGQDRWLKSMKIADANVVLRYLLNDNEELSDKAAKNVPDSNCLITFSFAERLTID